MTKEELEQLKKEMAKGTSAYYLLSELAPVLEQAWAERDDAILYRNGMRDDLCGLNDELLEERDVLQRRLAAVEAREFPNTIITLQQTIVALKEERDALKQTLAITQKNLDDTFDSITTALNRRER